MAQPDTPAPRVLLVRPTALGDVCRTVPVLAALRKAMPDATLDWLVHDAFADAIRHHPALNDIVAFPRQRFGRIARSPAVTREACHWAGELRRRRYDIAIDLQGLFRSGLFTRLAGAPRRVGFANAREMAWLFYNRRHRVDARAHAVDRMLSLIHAERLAPADDEPDMRLYVGDDDNRWLDAFLSDDHIADGYATLAPTARWLSKCWPIERYTDIARRLLESQIAGGHILVLASPSERPQIQPLLDALAGSGRIHAPATTIGQMMAVISRTRLLVCNDSAALHMGVGFDRPIATIFGPTDPALVGPYRRRDAVVQADGAAPKRLGDYRRDRNDQTLIAAVGAEAVWRTIESQISRVSA